MTTPAKTDKLFVIRRKRFFESEFNGEMDDYMAVPPADYAIAEPTHRWGPLAHARLCTKDDAIDWVLSAKASVYYGEPTEVGMPEYIIETADPNIDYMPRRFKIVRPPMRLYRYVAYVYANGGEQAWMCLTNSKAKARRFAVDKRADSYALLYAEPGYYRGNILPIGLFMPIGFSFSKGRWIRKTYWTLAVPAKWGGSFYCRGELGIHRVMDTEAKKEVLI